MPKQFIMTIMRSLTQAPARVFSMTVVGSIVALVAVRIVGGPAEQRMQAEQIQDRRSGSENSIQRNCVMMPDGIKVCESQTMRFTNSMKHSWACGFTKGVAFPDTTAVRPPKREAIQAAQHIIESVGLIQNFDILEGDFKNNSIAYALIRDQKRYIVYDRVEFDWKNGKTNWKEMIILAHEIGHHFNGHTVEGKGSHWPIELEADRFAGFVASRLGGTLQNTFNAYQNMSVSGTKTHPPRHLRFKAPESGWRHSEQLKRQQTPACHTDWLGKPATIDSQSCRMATLCANNKTTYRIACEAENGAWLWR